MKISRRVLILFVAVIAVMTAFSGCISKDVETEIVIVKESLITVGKFRLEYIDSYLFTEFSSKQVVGREVYLSETETPEEVVRSAEKILFEVYGEEQITQQRPYIVMYDEENESWLISGNSEYLEGALGGVANIIISARDGKLLAIWHGE